MYPTPADAPPPAIVSSEDATVVFAKSICRIWFLTATTSVDAGVITILNLVEVAPSTFETDVMFSAFNVTLPVV